MIINSLYGTVTGTSTQAVNLLNYAMSFDSFAGSEYVIFNDSEYSFYIVWGDLKHDEGYVESNGDIQYIRYYRSSSSGYTGNYSYISGSDSNFSLCLSSENICTSNVPGIGFRSQVGEQYEFYNSVTMFLIFLVAMVFAIMIKSFRGFKS